MLPEGRGLWYSRSLHCRPPSPDIWNEGCETWSRLPVRHNRWSWLTAAGSGSATYIPVKPHGLHATPEHCSSHDMGSCQPIWYPVNWVWDIHTGPSRIILQGNFWLNWLRRKWNRWPHRHFANCWGIRDCSRRIYQKYLPKRKRWNSWGSENRESGCSAKVFSGNGTLCSLWLYCVHFRW